MKSPTPTGLVLLLLIVYPITYEVSEATNRHVEVPKYCRNSYATIQCFEKCEEDPEIERALAKQNPNQTLFEDDDLYIRILLLEQQQHTPGIMLPCRNKCETEPLYWTCVADCDNNDHTSLWVTRCFLGQPGRAGNVTTCTESSPGIFQLDLDCQHCLYLATKERFQHTCYFSHHPTDHKPRLGVESTEHQSLCETLEVCGVEKVGPAGNITEVIKRCISQNSHLEKARMCVNDFVVASQRQCCYSEAMRNATMCRKNDYKCDQICEKILPPRLCRENCAQYRNHTHKDCSNASAPDVCKHCSNSAPEGMAYEQAKVCFNQCPTADCIRNTCIISNFDLLTTNCMNPEHALRLALFAKGISNSPEWERFSPSGSEDLWMTTHFTPLECPTRAISGNTTSGNNSDWEDCEKLVAQERSRDEIESQCKANPLRSLDMLACSLQLKLANLSLPIIMRILKDKDCENQTIQLELYKLMIKYEEELCSSYCVPENLHNHPNRIAELKCRINKCHPAGHSPHCKPLEDDEIVQLTDFASCRWKVDLSRAERPYTLEPKYFNELGPIVVNEKLEYPDTTRMFKTVEVNGEEAHYSFPYFIVIRGNCGGNYYADAAYRMFITGGTTPVVEMSYTPPTPRHFPKAMVRGVLHSALIRLERKEDETLIPENPRSIGGSDELGCHAEICYPGFAVPLMFLQVPHVELVVNAQQSYSMHVQRIYVAPFHSRFVDGDGEIHVAGPSPPVHPGVLFPKERSSFAQDTELLSHHDCYANDISDKTSFEYHERDCPELDHILDADGVPLAKNPYFPLDAEDIFRAQYFYGTSSVQAIAGFHDPRFLIIGDADMNNFEIVDWGNLLKELEEDTSLYSCIQHQFQNREYEKPMYSQLDRTDPKYPIDFYRQRYIAKSYHTRPESIKAGLKEDYADTAIFEAIGLEDRLLLVTTKGLVSYYGQTNATATFNKAFSYNKSEILNRCFKIVRILPKTQPNSDTIAGITYDYSVSAVKKEGDKDTEEITQQLWVGKFTFPGHNIEWSEVKSDPLVPLGILERDIVSYHQPANDSSYNSLESFPEYKNPGFPYSLREAHPKSEVEVVCYKAFRTEISSDPQINVITVDEPGWCSAIDMTPLPFRESNMQILIRLRVYHITHAGEPVPVYFYIIASNDVRHGLGDVTWEIDSIIPRIPCTHVHREAVTNVLSFDRTYFQEARAHSRFHSNIHGCHESNRDWHEYHIYLNGMSYTRSYSNHLFLYGSILLQSTNQGGSFVYLKSFPSEFQQEPGAIRDESRRIHRITKMAFDDGGHYAFLTNKLELWIGSAGAQDQIRLRPSPMWSIVQVGVSKVKGYNDGIPISVDFDSQNNCYEIVAIVGEDGFVSRIMKRPVDESKLLKVRTFLQKSTLQSTKLAELRKKKKELSAELQRPFHYELQEWTNACPYLSPQLGQNFSRTYSTVQRLVFPHPEQHILLGNSHTEGSLVAFQTATFTLVWQTIYKAPDRNYVGMDSDPFQEWARLKATETALSILRFTQGLTLESDAILVQPQLYKRQLIASKSQFSSLIQLYNLDYLMVAELKLEFSIRNDYQELHDPFDPSEINGMELNIENANGNVIQINTEKEIHADDAAVLFIIRMSVNKKTGLSQHPPGINVFPVTITYHLIRAFGSCTLNRDSSVIGDKITAVAMVGCPATWDFVFDWNQTLSSLKFRGDRSKSFVEHGTGEHCHGGKFVCFFSRSPLIFHFKIFDEANQIFRPYNGKYIMRILGGGTRRERMRMYTQEEMVANNIPGVSDVSLIWNEWDPELHQKVEQIPETLLDSKGREIKRDSREVILEAGKSTILWVCHTLSPCARISPQIDGEAVFWFKIFITNRGVEPDTLCLFEKEFDVMLYGFAPSPEFQLLITLGFSCILLGVLYVLFLCGRRNQLVWIQTKETVNRWIGIVKESVPHRLRFYEKPAPERRPSKKRRRTIGSRGSSSSDSLSTSGKSSSQVMRSTSRLHTSAVFKKELAVGQQLNIRLKSIVMRNRELKSKLLKTARFLTPPSDMLVEQDFVKEFGRTVSLESAYTPPMPKDTKGGFQSFL